MRPPKWPWKILAAKCWESGSRSFSANHQNKTDTATAIVRKWIDTERVDAVADVTGSGIALAVNELLRDKNRVMLAASAATSDLTGKSCSPTTVQFSYDTYALAKSTGIETLKQGGDTWFFITADYAFGHALERDTSEFVKQGGGKILGAVRAPLGTTDYSSFLLQAQSSKAKIVGLATAGGDTITVIKQAADSVSSRAARGLVACSSTSTMSNRLDFRRRRVWSLPHRFTGT